MSASTQARKRHWAMRSLLTPVEVLTRTPYYRSDHAFRRHEAVARKVAFQSENATLRRLQREDLAKGVSPEVAQRNYERGIEAYKTSKLGLLGKIKKKILG